MLENLPDLRKGLKHLIALEDAENWAEAHHYHKWVFIPSLEIVADRMGITPAGVRMLL